jgi:hypothetical protein
MRSTALFHEPRGPGTGKAARPQREEGCQERASYVQRILEDANATQECLRQVRAERYVAASEERGIFIATTVSG